jgi:hypothetical protein
MRAHYGPQKEDLANYIEDAKGRKKDEQEGKIAQSFGALAEEKAKDGTEEKDEYGYYINLNDCHLLHLF